ncbi:MAG TPA: stalk domain-containing protein [Clostridia bacterium]|nr:stalk domain-containing protein [Clostridia bacterium]
MRPFVRVVVFLFLCLGLSASGLSGEVAGVLAMGSSGAWYHLPLEEEKVLCVAIDPLTPSILYAGSGGGGVSRSVDGGMTWTAANVGLVDPWVWSLAITPSTPSVVYAGTDGGGVFCSPDSGKTWIAVNEGLTNLHVRSLAINPLAPSILYAGTTGGVFRSTNGGTRWSAADAGLASPQVSSLAVNPLVPSIVYAGTTGGVFRSTNGGDSWTMTSVGLTDRWVWSLAIDPHTPEIVYAGTVGGVFRSANGGTTWSPVNAGLTDLWILSLAVDPLATTTVYAGTGSGGVSCSVDGGMTWTVVNGGLTDPWVWSIAVNPSSSAVVYAGTGGGGLFQYDSMSAYVLHTSVSPSDGGSVSTSPGGAVYARGTVVTLTALAAPGYLFAGWSGDLIGTQDVAEVTMNADTSVTALFSPTAYALTVDVSGLGSVSRAPDQASYALGTAVQLTADPAPGWEFAGWTGDVTTVMNPVSIVIGGAHALVAQFEPSAASLTSSLHMSVVGEGSVACSPDREKFEPGETVELRATPATGWRFAEWQGDLSGMGMTVRLPMTSSREVVAVFQRLPEEKQWSVALHCGTHGTITPAGTQNVGDRATVRIRIEPDAGYQVDRLLIDGIPVSLPTTDAQTYDIGPVTADSQVQCTFVAVDPSSQTHLVSFAIGSTWLTIDGRQTALDAAPAIRNGRTFLPVRAIVEAFGGTIAWHAELRVISISLNGRGISLQIGNQQAYVDGIQTPVDASDSNVVPIVISGRTFLPIRFVAESLGLRVEWNPATQTVTVQG